MSINATTSPPAGTSASGAQMPLAMHLIELAALPTATSAPMEVNNIPAVSAMGDRGVDTSDIYQGSDEPPSA